MPTKAQLDDSTETPDDVLLHVRSLVQEAIELVDASHASAEIGARLQEVMDALNRILGDRR